jgi:hypothetical protein
MIESAVEPVWAPGVRSATGVEGREGSDLAEAARASEDNDVADWDILRSDRGVKIDGLLVVWLIPGASRN